MSTEDSSLSEFSQIIQTVETEASEKQLFDIAIEALKRPETREVEFLDKTLRRIIMFTSQDNAVSLVVNSRILVIREGEDERDVIGSHWYPQPLIHIAWANREKKTGGSYAFQEKRRRPIAVYSPYFQKHHFEWWNDGEVLTNRYFVPLAPPEEDVNLAIDTIKHGKVDLEMMKKCIELYPRLNGLEL